MGYRKEHVPPSKPGRLELCDHEIQWYAGVESDWQEGH